MRIGRLRVEGVQRIATRGERTANTDVPDFPDRSYSYSFSTHGALASFRGFARMSSMKTIVIVGSINTDLVMRAPRHALPGETLRADSFEVFTGGKGAHQAGAAARLGWKSV